MNLIRGDGNKIADCKIGETILIHLINGKVEKAVLNEIKKIGIEAFHVDLTYKPLTFYPYTSIIKITKFIELT